MNEQLLALLDILQTKAQAMVREPLPKEFDLDNCVHEQIYTAAWTAGRNTQRDETIQIIKRMLKK